jgi:hypothetical protein
MATMKTMIDALRAKIKATRESLQDKAQAAKYETEAELLTAGAKVAEQKARTRWNAKSK